MHTDTHTNDFHSKCHYYRAVIKGDNIFHGYAQTLTGVPRVPGEPWGPVSPGDPWKREGGETKEEVKKCLGGSISYTQQHSHTNCYIINCGLAFTSKPSRPGGPWIPGRPSSPWTKIFLIRNFLKLFFQGFFFKSRIAIKLVRHNADMHLFYIIVLQ